MPRINIELPDELHKQIKGLAIEKDKHLKTIIPEILQEYVKNERKKK